MSELIHLSAGAQHLMATGSNLVDLDAERRARLRVEVGTAPRTHRSAKRAGRPKIDTVRTHPRPALGRDGPDAA